MARARRHAARLEPTAPAPTEPATTTADDVRAWLVAFFTDLPNAPVYAASRSGTAFVDPDRSPSGLDWPRFTADVLGPRSRERLWVLTWARCEARRRAIARNLPNPPAGGSIREFCHEFGVHRATFNRTVDRSLAALAREWDRRREGRIGVRPEGPDPPGTIANKPRSEAAGNGGGSGMRLESTRIFRPPVSTTQS